MTKIKKAADVNKKSGKKLLPGDVEIGIEDVSFHSFKFTDRIKQIKKQPAFNEYQFSFKVSTVLQHDKPTKGKGIYTVHLTVEIYEKTGVPAVEVAKLNCSMDFLIINLNDVVITVDGRGKMPAALAAYCVGLCISAARGMVSMNIKDSIISNAILPLIDVTNLISNHKVPE